MAVVSLVLAIAGPLVPFHDEWWYLCGRSLSQPLTLLKPHNEHLVALHAAAYLAIADVFGSASSMPQLVAILAAHLAFAAAIWRLTGRVLATAVVIALGAGAENLLWGFQLGFVAAAALGAWALVAFVDERPATGGVLLVLAVATQGVGLFYLPAVAAYALAGRRPRDVTWLAPAAALWIAWALLESSALQVRGGTRDPLELATYVGQGVVAALGMGAGLLAAILVAVVAIAAGPQRMTPLAVAGIAGLLGTFAALALTRYGFSAPDSSRYLYVAIPFVLLTIVGLEVRRRVLVTALLAGALAVNATLLVVNAASWPGLIAEERAAGSDVVPAGVCIPGQPPTRSVPSA